MPSRNIIMLLALTSVFLSTMAMPTKIEKRETYTNAQLTFQDVGGLGACDVVYSPADFAVSLDIAQWDGGAHCGEFINISYNGKTVQASIVSECPGCPEYGLDLTAAAFVYLTGSLEDGLVYGNWSFA